MAPSRGSSCPEVGYRPLRSHAALDALLDRISEARSASAGSPLWLRGHAEGHKLIPLLHRFHDGLQRECDIFERFAIPSLVANGRLAAWLRLIEMHDSYVPTRLLEWTDSLRIALFCAVMRESADWCVYVLDPIVLNRCSDVHGLIDANGPSVTGHETCLSTLDPMPVMPIAVRVPTAARAENSRVRSSLFTVHGASSASLDAQCPESVVKVSLDDSIARRIEDIVLSPRY